MTTNPKVGLFEAQGISQMSDPEWEYYLSQAIVMFAGGTASHQIPALDPALMRSLMNVLRRYVPDAERELAQMERKGLKTEGNAAHDLRRLCHWATIQSYPVGAYLSQRRYGVDPRKL